jgi:hypothetical protein
MKSKNTPNTKTSNAPKKPDLRHGLHGSLTINSLDAGQSSTADDTDLKPAAPDLAVPVGQTTHE